MKQIEIGIDGFAVPLEIMTSTTGIFGLRGSGKTNLAGVLAEGIVKAGQPLCVIDPTGSWFGMKSSRDGKSPGLPVYVFGGEHADVPLEPTAGAVLADFMVDQRVPTILDLSLMRKGEMRRFMIAFAENLFHKNRQPLAVMIDETPIFAPQTIRGGDVEASRCLGAVEDLATLARRKGVGVVAIAQRPALVNTTLRTQFENLIVLRTIGKHDRVAIDEWVEAKGSKQERDIMMGDLAGLPNGTGYFWSPGFLGEFRKVPFRLRETFDSSKTPRVGEKIINPKVFAEIDKARLSAEIAATVEKAKAEDPKEIRKAYEARLAKHIKRIRELESTPQSAPVDPEAERQRLQEAVDKAVAAATEAHNRFFHGKVQEFGIALSKSVGELVTRHFSMNGFHPPSIEIPQRVTLPAKRAPQRSEPARKREPAAYSGQIVRLPIGEKLTLIAASQYLTGVTRKQLSILTGYKRSSRDAYVQRLLQKGLVELGGRGVIATTAGVSALGSDYEALPEGAALRSYWLLRLPEGERRILQILIENRAHPVARETLDEKTGYKRSSRDAYIQRLLARELVEVVERGEVRASQELI